MPNVDFLKKYNIWVKNKFHLKQRSDYAPFIKINEISSKGTSHRILGFITKREHHLFSDLELKVFLLLDWSLNAKDIREQYPLVLHSTKEIAKNCGAPHPKLLNGKSHIMTTDFFVDYLHNNEIKKIAIQAKYSGQLDDKRTIEKLEIERRYWQENNIEWKIVTEKDLPMIKVSNLMLLHEFSTTSPDFDIDTEINTFRNGIYSTNGQKSIIELTKCIDSSYSLPIGTSLRNLKILLSKKYILFDTNIPFLELTCKDLVINNELYGYKIFSNK
ncbi:MAG: TnsA endonuclease N-terminal domain-containing protein [Campylobacteraceae bacterium]